MTLDPSGAAAEVAGEEYWRIAEQWIDHAELSSVTGGESSTTQANLGVQVPTKAGTLNVGVSGSTSTTDYATCVKAVAGLPGIKPADIAAACGLPPGSQQR